MVSQVIVLPSTPLVDWQISFFFPDLNVQIQMTDTSSPLFPVYVWFIMFSCCLQKQKAVCPLHYLTPLHFRSTVGEKLKDIVPSPAQKNGQNISLSFLLWFLFVLNALTSLQTDRVVAIVWFTCFVVCPVYISTALFTSYSFITGFCSRFPLLSVSPRLILFQCSLAARVLFSIVFSMRKVLHVFLLIS